MFLKCMFFQRLVVLPPDPYGRLLLYITRAHTARTTIQFFQQSIPDFIEPEDWPSKSPDINILTDCLWS